MFKTEGELCSLLSTLHALLFFIVFLLHPTHKSCSLGNIPNFLPLFLISFWGTNTNCCFFDWLDANAVSVDDVTCWLNLICCTLSRACETSAAFLGVLARAPWSLRLCSRHHTVWLANDKIIVWLRLTVVLVDPFLNQIVCFSFERSPKIGNVT